MKLEIVYQKIHQNTTRKHLPKALQPERKITGYEEQIFGQTIESK